MANLYARHHASSPYVRQGDNSVTEKARERWRKEKVHFALNVVGVHPSRKEHWTVLGMIDNKVNSYDAANTTPVHVGSPIEYEMLCASLLTKAGWSTRNTPATGDQGADIIADKAGERVVVQCKLYRKPVGNKAVQEVVAAKKFVGADFALVVAPNGFTASARELAAVNGVTLCHHDELLGYRPRT